MPGPKRGFTTPHSCATVDSMARNQPSERDRKAHEKLQGKVSDFQDMFDDNIYLSIGLEAKHDIYNFFNPNEPYDIHLEPPSHDHPPLVEINLWMLYTPQAPMLDLTGEHIKTKEDI